MKNKYKKRSHISLKKMREIIHCFSLDLTATNTSQLTGISSQQLINISIDLGKLFAWKV